MGYKWQPLREASSGSGYRDRKNRVFIERCMEQYGVGEDEAIRRMEAYDSTCQYWLNDLYQVQTRRFFNEAFKEEMVHINIRRRDGAAIFDWRHRQKIKNELVGEECEAFEVYPAESRLSDEANKYHLWAFINPKVRLPVDCGDGARHVEEREVKSPAGARQRGY